MSFLCGIAFYADNRLGIVGAAKPFLARSAASSEEWSAVCAEPRKARPACSLSLSKGRQGTARNIDGIPDIVQIDNGVLKIIEGTKLNENGEISFNKEQTISGISYLSKNETSSKVYGGSVSAQGSVKHVEKTTPYGNIKNVVVEPQATSSASGGLTYSKSSSLQTHGIGDINSDGLPDYYNGIYYALNNGSFFSPEHQSFCVGNMSESKTQSIGLNFSVGIGASGSANLSLANNLKSGANATVGITYNSTSSNTEKLMMDINGDGLQDILEMKTGSLIA